MKLTEAKRVLELINTKKIDLSEEGVVEKIKKARGVFIKFYKNNPSAFIGDFITINDGKTNEIIPFKLNKAQQEVVKHLDKRFICAPKARQLGITTLTNALALHHALFVKSANVTCMSINTAKAQGNLKIIKSMFRSMPDWVQKVVLLHDEGTEHKHQDNLSLWTFKSRMTNTDISIRVASASATESARGDTPTFLHWTETAFADEAEDIFTSIFPGLSRKAGSMIILESTGNGSVGFFHDVSMGVKKGFEVIFLPWHYEPEYKDDTDKLEDIQIELVLERMGIKDRPEYLLDNQMSWYLKQSETLGKAKCQQEYPLTVSQVFQATSNSFFTFEAQNSITSAIPKVQMNMQHNLLSIKTEGPGKIFELPDPEMEYLISVDPCVGETESSDATSINVFNPDGVEVASWHEKMAPDSTIDTCIALAKYYNDALLVIENNGIGEYINRVIVQYRFYSNVYAEVAGKYGIMTNVSTKPIMVATLQNMLTTGKMIINNSTIKGEMQSFEAHTMKAQKGSHDDAVMSAAIGAYAFSRKPPLRKAYHETHRNYFGDGAMPKPKSKYC